MAPLARIHGCAARSAVAAVLVVVFAMAGRPVNAAVEKAFTLGGATLTLEDVSADVEVRYQSMRLNRALNVWNVEATLTNKSNRVLDGPFILLVESFTGTTGPLQFDGIDSDSPAKRFYDVSGATGDGHLLPGERSPPRTLTLGLSSGSPSLVTKVFAAPNRGGVAVGLVRSLNQVGQPLAGIQIEERGPNGATNRATDPVFAVATVGQGAGTHLWKFTTAGYFPVWRQQDLSTGIVTIIISPRLTPRSTNSAGITPLDGGRVSSGSGAIQIAFNAGAVTENSTATLTPLTGQTLPALLPLGWSPLQSFWVEISRPLSTPATALLRPDTAINAGETAVLVRLNETTAQWEVTQLLTGDGTNAIATTLSGSGAYSLVIADSAPHSPPPPALGQPLAPSVVALPGSAFLSVTGGVLPASSPASRVAEHVTGTAQVMIAHTTAPLPSGFVLRGEVFERYRLNGGSSRNPPQYENFVIGYQRPGDASPSTLHAGFPLRPVYLFGSDELEEATVTVQVITPIPFAGTLLDARGGQVADDGVRVLAAQADVNGNHAAQLRRLNPTNFVELVSTNASVVAAFDLTVTGVAPGRRLLAQLGALPTNGLFVLARVLHDQGQYGLQPIERMTTDASGRLLNAEPPSGDRLDGLFGAGQYVLLQVNGAQALVTGIARNASAQPTPGMPVRIAGQPWLAFSGADGSFKLLAPTGSVEVAVTDLATGDTGQTTVVITNPNTAAVASLTSAAAGPRVLSINPTNGAVNVSRVTPIEIAFSEPINPGSVGVSGIQLLDTNGQPVVASVTLNLRNTVVTLLPTDTLDSGARYRVVVSTNISDLTGLRLEGPGQFFFDTQKQVARGDLARLTIFEPGATNIPVAILNQLPGFDPGRDTDIVVASGSPGTAESEVAVILINETSGETATVLSKTDGSFAGFVRGEEDDLVSAVFVNANGTRTRVPVTEQKFDDGRVGLYRPGGILEAESDGGAIQVLLEPNAIPNKNKFSLEAVGMGELLALLQNTLPENSQLLGGFQFSMEGDELKTSADVSFPVNPSALNLMPGESPTNRAFALCEPLEIEGVRVFNIIDSMEFQDGKLVTRSPPFPGLGAVSAARFLAVPIMMAFGTKLTIAGQVVGVSEAAGPLTEAEMRAGVSHDGYPVTRLAGAVVNASPQTAVTLNTPALRPGAIVSRANRNGFYALQFPVNSLDPDAILLRALHPRFPGMEGRTPVIPPASSEFSAAAAANIIIRLPGSGSFVDRSAPILTHTLPGRLQVGVPQTVTLNVRDDFSTPSLVSATIEYADSRAVLANRALFAGEATIGQGATVTTGAQSIQVPVTFNVSTSAVVIVEAIAQDAAGNARTNRLSFLFGASPQTGGNVLTQGDPDDDRGPMVASVNPQRDGTIAHRHMIIRFDEAIDKGIELNNQAVTVSPPLEMVRQLSANQRELLVTFSGLSPGTTYAVTLNAGQILDLADKVMVNSYSTTFRTPPADAVTLSQVQNAVGTLAIGAFTFTLDRLDNGGALVSHRTGDSATAPKVGSLSLPPFPRTMALLPRYAFKRTPLGPVETNTLIAVAGGLVGDGQVGQWLWIINVADGQNLTRVASELVTIDPSSTITAMRWSPPRLCLAETRAEGSLIHHVNLQAFILGSNRFATNRYDPGLDANADGDFVDPGDRVPIPERLTFFGDEFVSALEDKRLVSDFAVEAGGLFEVAVVASRSVQPSFLQVLVWQGVPVADAGLTTDGRLEFPIGTGSQARRVELDLNFPISDSTGTRLIPAALVAVDNQLRIVDLSDPIVPKVVRTNELAGNAQNIFSITRAGDDEYAVGTLGGVFVLSRTIMGSTNGLRNAVKEFYPDLPMQGRVFGATDLTLSAAYGGVPRLVNRAPRLRVVRVFDFPVTPVGSLVLSNRETRVQFVRSAVENEFLTPAPLSRCAEVVSELSSNATPNPFFNYYVMARAPGISGQEILATAESLDGAMELQTPKGEDFPPIILSDSAGAMNLGSLHPPVTAFKLRRLSDDPMDDLYHSYVASPFVLVLEPLSSDQETVLASVAGRKALWSGDFVRVSFDSGPNGGAGLTPFLSTVSSFAYTPGLSRSYRGFRGEYIDSPNPSFPTAVPRVVGVDMQSGEYRLPETDFFIEGRLQDLQFTRLYESRSRYVGPFGRGWDYNYNARIIELPEDDFPAGYGLGLTALGDRCRRASAGDLLFIDGAGSVLHFARLAAGDPKISSYQSDPALNEFLGPNGAAKVARFYDSPANLFSVLYKLTDGKFMMVLPTGGRLHFLPDGRLDRTVGVYEESVVQCDYGDDGRLISVTGDRDIKLEIGYYKSFPSPSFRAVDIASSGPHELGKIARIRTLPITAYDREVEYKYDATGNLERVKPNHGAETVLRWSQGNPHELLGLGEGDGTGSPGVIVGYQDGIVTRVKINNRQYQFGGAKSTAAERFAGGANQTVGFSVGTANVDITVDERGRPTFSGNRGFRADDQGRARQVASTFTESELFYDEGNPVYRFRGNVIRTEQITDGGNFVGRVDYDNSAWNRPLTVTDVNGVATTFSYSSSEIREITGPVTRRQEINDFGQSRREDVSEAGHAPFTKTFHFGLGGSTPDGGLLDEEQGGGGPARIVRRDNRGRLERHGAGGITYTTIFNDDNQPEQMNGPAAVPSVAYTYDEGRVKTETLSGGGQLARNTYTYDSRFIGKVKTLTRDETGLPQSTTEYFYDDESRLERFIVDGELNQLGYDGVLNTSAVGPGYSREINYDAEGRPTSVIEQGIEAILTYDNAGRIESVTQQGATTELTYDTGTDGLRQRLKSKKILDEATGETLADESYTYDAGGRIKTITSLGRSRSFEYFADHAVRQMRINGTLVRDAERNSAGAVTRTRINELEFTFGGFNPDGKPQQEQMVLLPSGRTVTFTRNYDSLGRVRLSSVPGIGATRIFTYDSFGNGASETDPDQMVVTSTHSPGRKALNVTFGDGHTVQYRYNAQRRLERITGGPADLEFTYADGLLSRVTYPDGTTSQYLNVNSFFEHDTVLHGSLQQNRTWDEGRLTGIAVPATGDEATFEFDPLGRLVGTTFNDFGVGFDYDAGGNLSLESSDLGDWSGDFNSLNHLLRETYPSGLILEYAPDGFGQPTSVSAVGISSMVWLGAGIMERAVFTNGLSVVLEYDPGLRVQRIVYERQGGATLAGFEYALSPGGRVLSETRLHENRSDVFIRSVPGEALRVTNFVFSSGPTGAAASVRFNFTTRGEVLATASTAVDLRGFQPALTEQGGRLATVDGIQVSYNDQGSITNVPLWIQLPQQPGLTRRLAGVLYDGLGLVREVRREDGVRVVYTRDGMGRVVHRELFAGAELEESTDYLWRGRQLIEEVEQRGNVVTSRRYIYLGARLVLVQRAVGAGPFENFLPLVSLNGSVGGYIRSDGTLVETILYGAYGLPVFSGTEGSAARSAIGNTLLFHGAFYDEATGLYQMGQRNLHPLLGRFLQRDSQLFIESAAMFSAFNGDPVSRVDMRGTASENAAVSPYERIKEARANATSLDQSLRGFEAALKDSTYGYKRDNEALGFATLDLAQNALKLSGTFGDDAYRTTVKETLESMENWKAGLEAGVKIVKGLNSIFEDRELLSAIKAVTWSVPVNGPVTFRKTFGEDGVGRIIHNRPLVERFSEDANFKKAWFRPLDGTSGYAIVESAEQDYFNKRTGHLLSIGKGVHALADLYLKNALEDGDESYGATLSRQLMKTSGALLDVAEGYRKAVDSDDLKAMRRIYAGNFSELKFAIGEVRSAASLAWLLGVEGGKLGVLLLSDEDTAMAYQEQVKKYGDNGGWLTVASGILSTMDADGAALAIQSYVDVGGITGITLSIYEEFARQREQNENRTRYYLNGLKGP